MRSIVCSLTCNGQQTPVVSRAPKGDGTTKRQLSGKAQGGQELAGGPRLSRQPNLLRPANRLPGVPSML